MGFNDDPPRGDQDRRPRRDDRREGPQDRDPHRPTDRGAETPERVVRTVREVKNEHGTRVSRRITCVRCKVEDRVQFIPRNAEQMLCRKCAASEMDIADPSAGILPEKEVTCLECGRVEMTTFLELDEYRCRDCHRGIYSQQDDRNRRAEVTKDRRVLRVRRDS